MTTDFRMVASFRKGSCPVACAADQKTAYCTTLLLTALLGCSGVFSRHLARLYGHCRCWSGPVQRPFRLIVALIHSSSMRGPGGTQGILKDFPRCNFGSLSCLYMTLPSPLSTDIPRRVAAVVERQRLRARHTRARLGWRCLSHTTTISGRHVGHSCSRAMSAS